MSRQAGYTLLELLVVLTIMGILTAAVPGMAFQGIASIRFSGEVEAVTAKLVAAHQQAIDSGQTITMQLADLAAPGLAVSLPSASSGIVFYPDGSAAGSAIAIHYLGRRRLLVIAPLTGQITSQ